MSEGGERSPVDAVMVVGGGIGGMQASLDLAANGFKVYLIDNKPAIGGIMAQLDKTFPTNDCAMCIMSPKLVECGRHKDIELITYADILGIDGEPGNFTVHIKKLSRYIDLDKCTGCLECVEKCPVELENEFEQGLSKRKAIYKLYPQAIPNAVTIEKTGTSPCTIACPAGIAVQGYIALTSQGKFKEALEVIRERMPFPSVCGRVCHHPCEEKCNRNEIDEPVAIRPLKRFLADWGRSHKEEKPKPVPIKRDEKIAIVGAGPAGLTAAQDLRMMGYPVTVFESSERPGGMLLSTIPSYRLPEDTAEYDIERILANGIEIKTGITIGKDISLGELRNNYKAIFIAIGAQNAKKLRIEGIENKGVLYGIPFLKDVKIGKGKVSKKRVIVIGGGNVAIDCARSALRLDAKSVDLVCLETRDLTSKDRMPAHKWEIEEAEEEGVKIHGCWGPKKILSKNGKVIGLEIVKCTSVYEGEARRFSPKFDESKVEKIDGDIVIIAIGQEPDFEGFKSIEKNPWKTFKVDPITLETNVKGIFAGGDVALGPASVVEAVGQGHEAAVSIDRFILGKDLKEGREKEIKEAKLPEREIEPKKRQKLHKREPLLRIKDFKEIEIGYEDERIAIEEAKRCLNCGTCSLCLQCVVACKANAIIHDMVARDVDINVGAVILTPGVETFNPELTPQYGYGVYPNVVTSVQYERILSASGPFEGHIERPSDRKPPKRIAWLSCIGSRDSKIGNDYCSSVCCMYSTKEALITQEHAPGTETTIFFMDQRAYGKDFDRYYEKAKKAGVRYIRSRNAEVREDRKNHNLILKYESENGELREEEFELVVLSVGFAPSNSSVELAKRLGIELNEYKFAKTGELTPVETSREGIFVAGSFQGPKDIPETVIQATGAAAMAESLLMKARWNMIKKVELPPEKDVTGQEPRIGVFICRCGINIGAYVDVPKVVEYAKTLPNVAYAEENLFTCSQDTQQKIKNAIEKYDLNRVIVASCTPRTHEPLFQETIREAGLNPHLFEMANIRDQCSWIHMNEPKEATEKAKDLVRMAVAKARFLEPLKSVPIDVTQKALVIGGGIAGMVSSLRIAEEGFEVFLIEREDTLGGNAKRIFQTIQGEDVQHYIKNLEKQLQENSLVHIYLKTTIKKIEGYVGNFKTELKSLNSEPSSLNSVVLEHGVIIVATGAEEEKTDKYFYGKDERVVTNLELEEMIGKTSCPDLNHRNVVFIQCVGSRNDEHPYCSRVCCGQSIKNALKLKERFPDCNIVILYRDMRTYGIKEKYYEEARTKGVIFIRYEEWNMPEAIMNNGNIFIGVRDQTIGEDIILKPDMVVITPCIVPRKDNEELAKMLKVPLNEDGFFLEAHVKLRPVDFATEGIFLAGMAHGPKYIEETIAQANAAVSRACTILSKDKYHAEATVAMVNEDICNGCGICEPICAYEAIEIIKESMDGTEKSKAKVNEALCKGCGACVAACPSGAMEQKGFKSEQLLAMIDACLEV
ncbi:MAG: 4Fe-4S ferredoxin [Candidatus Cloacimonas sp. 4484_209]|nr:MAG: 4Fe-4S ferredoxin [Candidatus Cloacimonas sp. 4484_209]